MCLNHLLASLANARNKANPLGNLVEPRAVRNVRRMSRRAGPRSPSNDGTSYVSSCSFDGVARGPVTIVSGTGSNVGITGRLTFTLTEAGQGTRLKTGNAMKLITPKQSRRT